MSQLQSLQESLSEEKNATALLQKQKQTLKSMIGNLNTEVSEFKNRIDGYEAAEQELRNELRSVRSSLAEKEDLLATMAAKPTPNTPIDETTTAVSSEKKVKDYPRTPEVFEYRSTISSLEANLSRKTERCDELTVEVGRLRAAVTAKIDELGHHKAQFIKVEAELQATLLEKERTIEVMQELITRLEDQAVKDSNHIDELNAAIISERTENKAHNDMFELIKAKDDATESMLKDMSEQRMAMSTRFVEIEDRVSTLTSELRDSELRYDKTAKLLKNAEDERNSFSDRVSQYKTKLADLEQASFDRVSELETQVSRQQRLLEDEKDEVVRLKKRLSSLTDLSESLSKTASEEKARVATTQVKVEELSEVIQSLRNQNERLKRESEADKREIESLIVAADDKSAAGDSSRKMLLAQVWQVYDVQFCNLIIFYHCDHSCQRKML